MPFSTSASSLRVPAHGSDRRRVEVGTLPPVAPAVAQVARSVREVGRVGHRSRAMWIHPTRSRCRLGRGSGWVRHPGRKAAIEAGACVDGPLGAVIAVQRLGPLLSRPIGVIGIEHHEALPRSLPRRLSRRSLSPEGRKRGRCSGALRKALAGWGRLPDTSPVSDRLDADQDHVPRPVARLVALFWVGVSLGQNAAGRAQPIHTGRLLVGQRHARP